MIDLYLISFTVGLVLFGLVVAYSYHQQKNANEPKLDDHEGDRTAPVMDEAGAKAQSKSNTECEEIESEENAEVNAKKTPRFSGKKTAALIKAKSRLAGLKENVKEKLSAPEANLELADKDSDTGSQRSAESEKQAPSLDKPTNTSNVSSNVKQNADAESSLNAIDQAAELGGGERIAPAIEDEARMDEAIAPAGKQVEEQPNTLATSTTTSTNHGGEATTSDNTKVFKDAGSVITDLVARVQNPNPIEQSELLSLFREHDFKFSRKVHIYGLNELTDMWRDIEFELPSARFLELGISIQLCDREGAMNEKELYDFQQMVYQFCERFDAPFEFSMDIDGALQQAQTLDQIGRRYDSMAVLNVVPKSKVGFKLMDIQSCARDLMMSVDKNGIFMKTEGQKNNITVLYRLACTDGSGHFGITNTSQASSVSVHDLVVYMNVPATVEPEMVFQQMVKDANDLAVWLDGKVVDRAGKIMTQRAYATLMQQISDIAYSMQQEGLMPGDAVAKKLF